MRLGLQLLSAFVVVALGGCSPSSEPEQPVEPAARETVFDPMTSTIGRAQGVQQTVDEQAAEQRRQIEAAER